MNAPKPSPLFRVHRILISAAIACAVVIALHGVQEWRRGMGVQALVLSAIALVGVVALVFYLRYFNAKIARR